MQDKFKAIVIDDVDLCREFLTEILEERGYEVASYASAESVPSCSNLGSSCQSARPCVDFLLTDNRMPHLTGLDFIEQQLRRGCKLVASSQAVISGSWTSEEQQKARELGCQIFEKPYDLQRIADWLSACEQCG